MDRRTFLAAAGALALPSVAKPTPWEWRYYGGDQSATRYAPLAQITPENVADLQPAWTHHVGDASQRPQTTIEATPICVDGVLYLTSAKLKVQALEAATGRLLWAFDPFENVRSRRFRGVNRGVSFWRSGDETRILLPASDKLYALDAKTGKPVESFGDGGQITLSEDFDHPMDGLGYSHSSPVVVFEDLILTGGGGGEGPKPAAPGHIRAFDARTGKRRWIFHTIPRPGQYGYHTWPQDAWRTQGGVNNWAGMSIDEKTGRLFVSLGSPAFDFYGGDRPGQNLFGNCVLALDARTGERAWHYQTVHHDVWDYDLPAQPILATSTRNGRQIDVVAQVTKTGLIFILDRQTGQPVFGVEERDVPQSDVPGEQTWPTQPVPLKPPPLIKQGFFPDDVSDVTPQSTAYVQEILDQHRHGEIFLPPSLQGTVVRPGFLGGALWGGASFDPRTGRLYVNASENANLMTLVEAEPDAGYRYGHKGYIRFFDHEQRSPGKPPWGHLTCVDMNTGEFVWREPLGEHEDLGKVGTRQIGGSIATEGGLVFIAATLDEKFRAFDSATGKELWSHQLNAGGYATPCTYEADGKQYVVIAAGGGGKQRTKAGDEYVAFALP